MIMTLTNPHLLQTPLNYREAMELKQEAAWISLEKISIKEAVESWLTSLESEHTRTNYASSFKRLVEIGVLDLEQTLQHLAVKASNALLDRIKQVPEWSEATKQARSASLLSFFRFLSRRTDGMIKRLQPSKEGTSKTFFKIRDTVVTEAMNPSQWNRWLEELEKINQRDALIAKLTLQGAKRIGEVLSLEADQICFDRAEITFYQSKSKTERHTVITYSDNLMQAVQEYIGNRSGHVFVTSSGKPVSRVQLGITFAKAGERAGIPFRVSPHVLRASAITALKGQGYSDSQIRQISGHASGEMVSAYDKRAKADNISKEVNLIG